MSLRIVKDAKFALIKLALDTKMVNTSNLHFKEKRERQKHFQCKQTKLRKLRCCVRAMENVDRELKGGRAIRSNDGATLRYGNVTLECNT